MVFRMPAASPMSWPPSRPANRSLFLADAFRASRISRPREGGTMARRATSKRMVKILSGAPCVATCNSDQPTSMKPGAKLSVGTTPDDQVVLRKVSSEITMALSNQRTGGCRSATAAAGSHPNPTTTVEGSR
jgi:hypothetical protein